jgi:spore germination protein KC
MFLVFFCLCLFLLPGCWGARETDELAYILTLGIDKGTENVINVTFQMALPRGKEEKGSGGEGGGEKEKTTEIISVEAASLFGALQLASAFSAREPTLIHNRTVIVSGDIAREGLARYINPLLRSREIRRNTFIVVTPGKARDFIEKNKPPSEKNPSRQFELAFEAADYAGFMMNSIINEFSENMKSPGREAVTALVNVNEGRKGRENGRSVEEKAGREVACLPGEIAREGGNKIDIIGLAAFRGDRLAGYLNGSETRYYQMASGKFRSAIITFPDPEKPGEDIIVMRLRKGRNPVVRVDLSGPVPLIDENIILEGEILSIQSGINYELGEKERQLQRYLEDYITREITKVIEKTQKEFKSDIFGFGNYTRRFFWTWQDWQDYRWLDKYPEAKVKVRTNLKIRRPGLMIRTIPVKGSLEGENSW